MIFSAKGENKEISDFTLIAGLQKIMKVNWSQLLPPSSYLTYRMIGADIKMPGIPSSTKQSTIIDNPITHSS